MLGKLREQSQSYLIYFFFGIIIVVFVFFFGPQSDACSPSQVATVASVDSYEISSRQIEQMYFRHSRRDRSQLGDDMDPVQRRLWLTEDVILTRLLAEEARNVGMNVSDEQLVAYIMDSSRNPDFQVYSTRDGSEFDSAAYQRSVAGEFGLSIAEYEDFKKDEMLTIEFMRMLISTIVVSPDEVESVYHWRNTRYQLEYVPFDAVELEELFAITDDDVAEVIAQDLQGVQAYYEANQDEYTTGRELRIRRIFVQIPDEDDNDPVGAASGFVRHAFTRAIVEVEPDSFAEVAEQYSDSTDAERGGDMGLRSPSEYEAYPFVRERIDDLEVNAIETYYAEGRYVLVFRLEEDNLESVTPLEEVQDDVARSYLEVQRGEPIIQLAESFLERAREGLSFEEIALEHAQEVAEASRLENGDPDDGDPDDGDPDDGDPDDGDPDDGDPDDGDPDDGDPDDGDPDDGEPEEIEPEEIEPEEIEPEEIEPILQTSETPLFALDRPAPELPPELAQYRQPDPAPSEIPGMGNQPELARDLMQLTLDQPLGPQVYGDGERCYIVRLTNFEPAPESIDEEEADQMRDAIHAQKASLIFGRWQERLVYHAPVQLSSFLRDFLDDAIDDNRVGFNLQYFSSPEPEPVEVE